MAIEEGVDQAAQQALDILRRTTWIQGRGFSSAGMCLGHAIWLVDGFFWELAKAVRAQIIDGPGAVNPFTDIQRWNDAEGRTEEEVHNVLKSLGAR